MRNSYHGRSFSTIAITGNRTWSPTSLSPFQTYYVHGGNRFRSPFAGPGGRRVRRRLRGRPARGARPGGRRRRSLIAEPIQGVGGFTHGPDGLLGAFAKELGEHGILWISDEVQTGWGRTGEHFWGWQAHAQGGATPDIVTFAKGIGNGLSVGGVIARAEIMDSLRGNSISTFGGSPVTAAGALANLRYLLAHDLQGNAAKVGPILLDGLRELDSPIVGDVRGKGLMIGVELVRPGTGTPGEPAPELASAVLEATKRRGLLVGKGGLYGNALRIAPPLSLTAEEAAEGLALLTASIEEVAAGHAARRLRARRRWSRREDADPQRSGDHRSRGVDRGRADRGREGGRAGGHRLDGRGVLDGRHRPIDATGCYVVPGGVDGHTHMEMPFGGTTASDTFETGTRAAAWGGTTTIVDFAIQSMGSSLREGLDAWHAKADGNCAIDYAFHMIMADVNEGSLKEMEALVGEGVTSFKLFMAYPGVLYSDDGQVLRAFQKGAETGGLILMHAENGIAIDVLIEQALARGETDPRYHGIVRHELLEAEATHRAIKLAQVANAPVYIVHLSAEKALAEVAKARDEGYNAFAETCPQYLFLSYDDLARPGFEGAKYVCSTPLRPREHQAALWRGLRTNDLSVVSTDHCPFCFKPQKEMGLGDFSKIPNGLPGRRAPDGPAAPGRGRRAHLPAALDRAGLRDARRGCSGSTRARARSRRARTRTSSSTTRTRRRCCRRRRTT